MVCCLGVESLQHRPLDRAAGIGGAAIHGDFWNPECFEDHHYATYAMVDWKGRDQKSLAARGPSVDIWARHNTD